MSNLVDNERIKLQANGLNSAASSSFAVGVLAPIAAAFYSVGSAGPAPLPTIIIGALVWLILAIVLHLAARRTLGGLKE